MLKSVHQGVKLYVQMVSQVIAHRQFIFSVCNKTFQFINLSLFFSICNYQEKHDFKAFNQSFFKNYFCWSVSHNPMCYHAVQCSFLNWGGGECSSLIWKRVKLWRSAYSKPLQTLTWKSHANYTFSFFFSNVDRSSLDNGMLYFFQPQGGACCVTCLCLSPRVGSGRASILKNKIHMPLNAPLTKCTTLGQNTKTQNKM